MSRVLFCVTLQRREVTFLNRENPLRALKRALEHHLMHMRVREGYDVPSRKVQPRGAHLAILDLLALFLV